MEYTVNSHDVKVRTKQDQHIFSVTVNTTPTIKFDQIQDVDVSNIQNNQVIMYDQATQRYKFVNPSEVLDRADDVDNNAIDFGSY
jgi:hypothetical protein